VKLSFPKDSIRVADVSDVDEIVRITNAAYLIEQFCLAGDRTDTSDVRSQMGKGRFLVAPAPMNPRNLCGSVYMSIADGRGYLGLLSVDPSFQGRSVAKVLVASVEDHCREEGCGFLDITVVNLRRELFPFYLKLGFSPTAVLPFPRPSKMIQPLHLVQMTKALRAPHDL
jgi:GNAT superfamily N-acetyltransferase